MNNMSINDFSALIKKHPRVVSPNKYQSWFDEIACQLMNHFCLTANSQKYRIVECEIYYNDDNHKDAITYKGNKQLLSNEWYFHLSGVDYTFGDKDSNIHAGILIRGIRKLPDEYEQKYISGPLNVLYELLNNSDSGNITLGIEPNQSFEHTDLYKATRFGVNEGKDVSERLYRFVTELGEKHHYKDKANVKVENKVNCDNPIS